MNYKNFTEYFQSKININNDFEDRLEEIMTGINKKKIEEEKNKKYEDELKKQLKDIENEKKIDYILNNNLNINEKENNNNHDLINLNEEIIVIENKISNDKLNKNNKINDSIENNLNLKDILKLEEENQNILNDKKENQTNLNDFIENNENKLQIDKNNEKNNLNPFSIEDDKDLIINIKKNTNKFEVTKLIKSPNNENKYKKIFQNNNNILNKSISSTNSNNSINNENSNNKINNNLLNDYEEEKKMINQLHKILSKNKCVSNNIDFQNILKDNNTKFYNISSKEKSYNKAKEILQEILTNNEKIKYNDLQTQLNDIKNQLNDLKQEKIKYKNLILKIQEEIAENRKKIYKENLDYEHKSKNELRSILTKFKIELYNNSLKEKKENNLNNNNNEEINKLKKEIESIEKNIKIKNKKFEREFSEIQNKLLEKNIENKALKKQLKFYEEKRLIDNLNKFNAIKNIKELEKINKENNNKNDDDEDKIQIKFKKTIISTKNHINELDLIFPSKYDEKENRPFLTQEKFEDGKIIKIYDTGKKEILFKNGTRKQIYPDGYILINYNNGDIKQIIPKYKETYLYKKDNILQIKFLNDGSQFIKYSDGKIEAIY